MSEDSARIKYLESQLTLARKEINNIRQQLKTLNQVHRKECDEISKKLSEFKCSECLQNQNKKDNVPSTSYKKEVDLPLKYIGLVNTQFPNKRGTPRQSGICSDAGATLILNKDTLTNPHHAIEGLEEFSHMWILFHFHRNDSKHIHAKVTPPRLNGLRMGVFATRSPHRPCPIGLSLVKIIKIVDNVIHFSGVDMVDQTPVLDIKPYIPKYDSPNQMNLYYPEESLYENDETDQSSPNEHDFENKQMEERFGETENVYLRTMDGEENSRNEVVLGTPSIVTGLRPRLQESVFSRSNSRIGEREAPDGEEEELQTNQTNPAENLIPDNSGDRIRIPAWIDQPPVSTLAVSFKDRAVAQLLQLGTEGEEKKAIITTVLQEDPRSMYLRERWGSHCYVFRIAELYVSCKFNDATHCVTVYQVFQNESTDE